jgi:hypothetical protein
MSEEGWREFLGAEGLEDCIAAGPDGAVRPTSDGPTD